MEVDLGRLIGEVIVKFNYNRTGPKPMVFAKIPPGLARVPWNDGALEKFIKQFLYDVLLANNPEMPIHIIVQERTRLGDLEGFVGVSPLYWVQLRIKGSGSGMIERMVEEIFDDLGYRCEERVGLEGSAVQLAVFSPVKEVQPKMGFCFDGSRAMRRCDFLIPVFRKNAPATFCGSGQEDLSR